MKTFITIFTFVLFSVCALSQTENKCVQVNEAHSLDANNPFISDSIVVEPYVTGFGLNLPEVSTYGRVMPMNGSWHSVLPYCGMAGNYGLWDVHQGLNTSIGMSVFSTFGSGHTWSGAGFSENVAMVYAMPLTARLSFSIGGYFQNTTWAHDTYRNAGLTASLGYRFDNHWSAYIYGEKSILQSKPLQPCLMDMDDLGDRIGAAVRYDFSPSFSVQLNVEARSAKTPELPVAPAHDSSKFNGIRR